MPELVSASGLLRSVTFLECCGAACVSLRQFYVRSSNLNSEVATGLAVAAWRQHTACGFRLSRVGRFMIFRQARSTFLQSERTLRKTFAEKARSMATRAFRACTTTIVSSLSFQHRHRSTALYSPTRFTDSIALALDRLRNYVLTPSVDTRGIAVLCRHHPRPTGAPPVHPCQSHPLFCVP